MALLTDDIQTKLMNLLVEEGLVTAETLRNAQAEAVKTSTPLFTLLANQNIIDDELLTQN